MNYSITERDKTLICQPSLTYKYRLFIVDHNKNVLDVINEISSLGTYTIDSESSIRRTTSITVFLDEIYRNSSIEYKLFHWIGYSFKLQTGIYSIRDDDYTWYDCGYYYISDANTSYNAADNSLSMTLSDWYSQFQGTRNGQIGGAPVISLPNEDENGQPITIKQTITGLLTSETTLSEYIIDDIGQFDGMPQNNPDYEEYRKSYPLWNQLPYDLEFDAGCHIDDILSEISNLYPNCQMYFDIYGIFCFDMVPSCQHSPITLDNDYLQEILLADDSENVTYDIESIKNVTEVFGSDYEITRYSASCTFNNNTYTILLDDYKSYQAWDIIAFVPDSVNGPNTFLQCNSLDIIPLYQEYTAEHIASGLLHPGNTYAAQIRYLNGKYVAYFLGQYQPHALCILTNDLNDPKYTKAYFSQKYNCPEHNIELRTEADSPFTVQKLGEILDVKSGNEFDNIMSDSVAADNARYYNRQTSSVNDTVTITTKMIPFLDVNTKVRYQKQQDNEPKEYIIKSISNDTEAKTSKITMYRFYPIYEEN